jgi:hypothetical protein
VYIANDYGIYAISKDYNLYAKWFIQLNDQVEYNPTEIFDPVIGTDGTLYVVLVVADPSKNWPEGAHTFLFAIKDNGTEGTILWKKELGSGGIYTTQKPVLGPTGLIYLVADADSDSTVYCLDTSKSGDIQWSTNIGSPINGNMIMGADQILYMVAGSSAIADFIGVDGKSGTILYRLNYAGTPYGDMAIATDGKIYYTAYHYTQDRNYYHTIMSITSDVSQNTTTTIQGGSTTTIPGETTTTTIPSETTTTTIPIDQSCEIISINPSSVSVGFGLLPRTRNITVTLNTDLTALGITGDDLVFDAPRGVSVLSAEVSANIIQASVLFWGVQPGTYNVTIGACGSIPFIVKRF